MPGPGYASPLDAMKNGPREKLLYVICIQPNQSAEKTDLLATVDVDPDSPTYCQIIHKLRTGRPGDELHHFGWNICSSCYEKECCSKRDKIIMPGLHSDRIYVVDVGQNEREPRFHKVIEGEEMQKLNCSFGHTTHCLASGEIMISTLGDKNGNAKGDFILLDGKTFEIKGTWTKGPTAKFGYDFWYQPHFDIMVSSEWGAPKQIKKGFDPTCNYSELYGQSINFYSWSKRELIQTIDLGLEGQTPLEIRFLHNPLRNEGFVGCAAFGTVYRFYLNSEGKYITEKIIHIKPKRVKGWALGDLLQGLIGDILLSLDDKYLYFSNWAHGDIRQYDITDTAHPKLTGQVFLGGQIVSDSKLEVLEDAELSKRPDPVFVKGRRFYGGPQMFQLSLDGKRLYVSSSLYSPLDRDFYPDLIKYGSTIVKLDIDVENGGMKLDENFVVDFGSGPDGPLLAHEIRYPGGDCTSDIWLESTEEH